MHWAAANAAPRSCATTKPGTLTGAMPAKLSLNMRPNTAAGLANEVAGREPVRRPDVAGHQASRLVWRGAQRRASTQAPAVATASAIHWPGPLRSLALACSKSRPNMACASQAPTTAPRSWDAMKVA